MKYMLIVLVAVTITACDVKEMVDPDLSPTVDQCLREQLFQSCMAALPAGPQSVKYNDWDEVVDSCRDSAYYGSKRQKRFVKPECRFGSTN